MTCSVCPFFWFGLLLTFNNRRFRKLQPLIYSEKEVDFVDVGEEDLDVKQIRQLFGRTAITTSADLTWNVIYSKKWPWFDLCRYYIRIKSCTVAGARTFRITNHYRHCTYTWYTLVFIYACKSFVLFWVMLISPVKLWRNQWWTTPV